MRRVVSVSLIVLLMAVLLPPACGGCVCRYHHLITTGDTLTRISVRYGVDMWSIAACNCIYNLNYIRIGYWLCIP